MSEVVVSGFVIVPPLSAWDVPHRDEIWSYLAPSSFGKTAGEAWQRHAQLAGKEPGECARIIQHWHDRGYRVQRATMTIHAEAAHG